VKRAAATATVFALACAPLATQLHAVPPVALTPAVQASYMLNCMGCHLPDGSGAAGKVPSLRETLVIFSASTAGRRYLVQVPGASRSPLSDLELAQVLSWMVRNLSARPVSRDFADFTAAEVARYRRAPLLDVRATRERLLQAAAARGRGN
jgi:mono/diheme cytochrome c family protein